MMLCDHAVCVYILLEKIYVFHLIYKFIIPGNLINFVVKNVEINTAYVLSLKTRVNSDN